jgi:D-alanine transfer protein
MIASVAAPRTEQMQEPPYARLLAGLLAVGALLVITGAVLRHDRARVRRADATLAPLRFAQKWHGTAAPLALLDDPRVLPLWGSSELAAAMPNRATEFFASYPTGFAVAPLGDRGYPVFTMALGLGSLGPALRGKRVVVSLSGTWFLGDTPSEPALPTFYSPLQVGDVLFSSGLPIELRRRIARRVMTYRLARGDQPLLRAALACLARRCVAEPLLPLLAPLWATQSLFWRAEDYHRVAHEIDRASEHASDRVAAAAPTPAARRVTVPWTTVIARGDSLWRARSATNAMGIADTIWQADSVRLIASAGQLNDSIFVGRMESAERWEDLDILLGTLQALGARPLILVSPLKGAWWDFRGVSGDARRRYYQRFDSVTARYGFQTRSFAERDGDPYFLSETRSHPSAKGWAVYDSVIDAFYHDARP